MKHPRVADGLAKAVLRPAWLGAKLLHAPSAPPETDLTCAGFGMSLINPLSRRLYLRIWLAVVGCMALLTLSVGWSWRIAQ
ncbi:hypothetical protein D8B31_22450, partial [Verminephrobacter eiseniae]|nr:hypothetical protein [Verminephrobacter eiseniae]MCW8225935.1 hypothetical protein [Verminephrobacter eiseniae]